MGLGPSDSRPGDAVAVIFGGQVPYVLRHEKEHFLFVGESYVQGLMKGQALDLCDLGKVQVGPILLK
jgi:hypothetical protein